MSFKYGLTLPALGGNKLARFESWAEQTIPGLAYRLPPQTPIKTETMTIRLRSEEDKKRLQTAFPATLP